MNQDICKAISQKSIVKFDYHGEPRIVEPHCHGISKKGNEVFRGYQISGGSISGNPAPWRLFIIDDIINFEITGQNFEGSRSGYNPNDSGMIQICCCL